MTQPQWFDFDFEERYRRAARLFGVTEQNSSITVDEQKLRARFGRWRVSTPLANIAGVTITGPYLFIKTAGPARLTFHDRGLTFATNSRRGVCLNFIEPIVGIDPFRLIKHPNLTLTPRDCDALARVLAPR